MNGRRSHLWGFVGWLTKVVEECDIGFQKRTICRVNNFSTCLGDIVIHGAKRTICRVNNCTTCLESRAGSADLFHAAALLTLYGSDITGKTQKMANAQWLWGIVTVFFIKEKGSNSNNKMNTVVCLRVLVFAFISCRVLAEDYPEPRSFWMCHKR